MNALSGKLLAWLLGVPALFIACILGAYVAQANYYPIIALGMIAILMVVYFTFGSKLWLIIPLGLALPFKANFLPLNFAYSELITGLALTLFLFQYIALDKRNIVIGPPSIWIPLLGIVLILLVHMLASGGGFRALGNEGQGARKYLPCFFGFVAYVLILTSPGKSLKALNKLPLLYFIATVIGVIPSVITTFVPGLTPIVFVLFGTANTQAYALSQGMTEGTGLLRFGDAAAVGIALVACIASYYPLHLIWKPSYWWVLACALFGSGLVMFSGYRSNLLKLCIVCGVIMLLRLGLLRSFMLGLLFGFLMLAVAFGHNSLYKLPYTVQRVLTPIPTGQWDPNVLQDSETSNSFREEVQDIYIVRYFKTTLFGNGFSYDSNELAKTLRLWAQDPRTTETFVVSKDFHVGWISLYDAVGIIGSAFMVGLIIVAWFLVLKLSRRPKLRETPIYIWLAAMLIMTPISYFTVFGSFPTLLSEFGVYTALLLAVDQLSRDTLLDKPEVPPAQAENIVAS